MTKWNRLLAALVAVVMLLTMPIMTGISRAAADGKTDTAEPMAHTHKWSGPAWTFRYTLADGSKVDVTDGLDPDGNEFDANKAYWIDTRYATFTCESCGQKKQVQVSGQTYEVVEDDPNATPSIEFSCPLLLNHAEVTFNGQTYATTEPLKLDSEHANAGWFLFCKDDSHGFKNEYRFTEKDENGDYVLEVEDLPLDVEVWVVYAVNCPETNGQGNDLPYHPFGKAGDMEHRLYTTEETSGHVKIYFNPECHDEWKDFYEVGFCYIEKIPDEPEEPIATITIQGESETVLYDGEEHTAIGFHGMIQNELMDKEFTSDHATDTNEHEAVFRGAWIDGNASEYRIVATTADPTEVEAGVYPNTITSVKVYVNDVDVTALYSVNAYNGKLTILSEPIATITIQGESETVLYDGEEHTAIGFHGMIQNQYMDKEFTSDHAADTNEHEAVFRGAWIDGNANEYRIVATTADPTEVEAGVYPNTITDVKVYVNDVDVTALYSVNAYNGKLTILSEPIATITIQGESETVLYDGEEHTAIGFHGMIQNQYMDKEFTSDHAADTNEHEAVFRGAWIDGNANEYRIVATTADPAETAVGTYANTITDVKVYVNDVDVTALYSVNAYNGKLTILSEPIATITIQGESETVLYDGEEHTAIGFHGMIQNQYMDKEFTSDHAADTNEHEAVFRGAWIDGNANEYRIVATTADPAETAVGTYANTVTNVKVYVNDVDVTALYSVISNDGMLNIVGEPAFKTQSLVLEGRIGINFFLYLPEADCYEYEGVAFEIDNTDGADAFVPFSSDMPTNANGYYQFTYYVRSIEMADTITATLKYKLNGDEKTLVKTYSVKQYFETFDNYTFLFSELEQAMTKATADYGHYVQAFLETTRTWVIGVDYAEMDKYYTDYTADDISAAQTGLADYVTAKTTGSNMEKITYTLVLDSDMELRVYFKPAEDYTGTFTFTVNGETVTEDGEKISAKLLSDGRYLVAIKNVAAHELYRVFEVKAVGDDGVESSMTVSALSYVNAMMTAYAGNEKAINAAVAIYRYAMAAKALRP